LSLVCFSSTKVTDGVLFFNKLLRAFTRTFTVDQVTDLLDCLEQTHAAGVVHRDICPENIIEDGQGKVYLIDWGFVRIIDSDSSPPEFEGTFRFASEHALGAVIRVAHVILRLRMIWNRFSRL